MAQGAAHHCGPSPRVWGNPVLYYIAKHRHRAIPTRVGKSPCAPCRMTCRAGHPHACGEITRRANHSCANAGPSPRVWGNHLRQGAPAIAGRAIPTRVGKSRGRRGRRGTRLGHPHACGEIQHGQHHHRGDGGPSPRVWGNRDADRQTGHRKRAIPTRVGKSAKSIAGLWWSTGHPHACGEIQHHPGDPPRHVGPSPRVWGNHLPLQSMSPYSRAIPTRVGKSTTASTHTPPTPGHPHACGEIMLLAGMLAGAGGPSPRVWGNRRNSKEENNQQRAIPTRVGKSARWPRWKTSCSGHPHACGEILQPFCNALPCSGPSPRVWGNLRRLPHRQRKPRAIPTRVGKSGDEGSIKMKCAGHPHACGEIGR